MRGTVMPGQERLPLTDALEVTNTKPIPKLLRKIPFREVPSYR